TSQQHSAIAISSLPTPVLLLVTRLHQPSRIGVTTTNVSSASSVRALRFFAHVAAFHPRSLEPHVVSENARTGTTTNVPVDHPDYTRESVDPKHLHVLDIDGREIFFDRRKVPPPPCISLADPVEQVWQEWECSRILKINGFGIPVSAWAKIYQKKYGIQSKAWGRIRNQWGKWAFIAKERERLGSDDTFWEKFSENGTHLKYEKISNLLQKEREQSAEKHAADATKFFGGDFQREDTSGVFMYRNSKKGVSVMKTKSDIARKWLQLLEWDVDVAARWAAMQAAAENEHEEPETHTGMQVSAPEPDVPMDLS
ncbi:hypothetical protein EIP91_001853, partial [Steccherinum ochraceum]